MSDEPIIEVKGLWKRYGLPPFWPWQKKQVADHEWALKDINFSVPRGGALGILGRNGAGKSTLLKLLAGVTPADKGEVSVRGKVFPMIELSAGMSPELSGRENIRILGTIMGLHDHEVARLIPLVEEFSELEDWIYRPVWQYSSGMVTRLAFGMAAHAHAEILLVDEVLSVGDIAFQKKCQRKINELLMGGTTLIFVSHSPYLVEKMCKTGLLLEKGRVDTFSTSREAMNKYLLNTKQRSENIKQPNLRESQEKRQGTGDIRVTEALIVDKDARGIKKVSIGDTLIVRISYMAKEDVIDYDIAVSLYTDTDMLVTIFNFASNGNSMVKISKGHGVVECVIPSFPIMGMGLYFDICFSSVAMYSLDFVKSAITFDSLPREAHSGTPTVRYNGIINSESQWRFIR